MIRTLKKSLSLFLVMLMVLTCVPMVAFAAETEINPFSYGGCGPNATWAFDEETCTLTISGTGEIKACYVDNETFVPYWYGYSPFITNVIIEEGITCIGDYAFNTCWSLETITIPKSVTTIGEYAFGNCESLQSIILPDSITSIGNCAFYECINLVEITIPEGVTAINDSTFYYCENLSLITIPESVKRIGNGAFAECANLISITIPNSVTSISSSAFAGCANLASITIPDSVTSIGYNAFNNCSSLKSITIPDSVTTIEQNAFAGCSNLESITIPNGVTTIGAYAFNQCSNLQTIEIPDSVTTIGENAFIYTAYYNNNSNWVNGMLYIDDCFIDIKYISANTCEIKENTKVIADKLLNNFNGLKEINVSPNNKYFASENGILFNKNKTTLIAFPKSSSIINYSIPYSVTCIGDEAFSGCSNLVSVIIPDSVTTIGKAAFQSCLKLTEITMSNNITNISESMFFNCSNLANVTIPTNITNIESYAFSDCSKLTNITIPNGVTTIGNWAFSNCLNLTSIIIPNSVTHIKSSAFRDSSNLTNITILNDDTNIENWVFENTAYYNNEANWENGVLYINNHLIAANYDVPNEITIKNGIKIIPEYIFEYRENIKSVDIPESVTTIGRGAFNNCSSLESITIPNSVTEIGEYAFSNCYNLQSVTLGSGLTEIKPNVFAVCIILTDITIPANVTQIDATAFFLSGLENIYFKSANTEINVFAWIFEEDGMVYPYFAIPNTVTVHAPCVITEASTKENLTPYKYANRFLDDRFESIDNNHDYNEWTTVTEPTIEAPGKEIRTCVVCEFEEERELSYTAVENITVNVSDVVLEKDATTTITATVTPDNATNTTLIYSSSDETVATVVDGVITAVGNGTAVITVAATENPDIKATVNVKVSVPVTEFDVTIDAEEVVEGETATITTNIPSDDVTVTYESLTPEYATVDTNGVITTMAPGEAVIKVTVTDAFGNVTEKEVTLTVKADFVPVTDIEVTLNGELKYVGDTIEAAVTVNPDATDKTFTFNVSPNVIARKENGKIVITAIGEGEATLTITAGDYSETFTLGIIKVKPSVTISAPTSMNLGDTAQIVITSNITDSYVVEYTSSDKTVITVDNSGNLIATGAGTATVTARVILEDGTVITKIITIKSIDPNEGKFFCSFCDDYEAMKNSAVGFIYAIVHFFIHMIQSINFAS